MRVKNNSGIVSFLCTAIYASPHSMKRKSLWECMHALVGSIVEPWFCTGDFNAILNGNERKRGSQSKGNDCRLFKSVLEDNNLQDMRFQGLMFT